MDHRAWEVGQRHPGRPGLETDLVLRVAIIIPIVESRKTEAQAVTGSRPHCPIVEEPEPKPGSLYDHQSLNF